MWQEWWFRNQQTIGLCIGKKMLIYASQKTTHCDCNQGDILHFLKCNFTVIVWKTHHHKHKIWLQLDPHLYLSQSLKKNEPLPQTFACKLLIKNWLCFWDSVLQNIILPYSSELICSCTPSKHAYIKTNAVVETF